MEIGALLDSATVRRDQAALKELARTNLRLLLAISLKCRLGPSPGWPLVSHYEVLICWEGKSTIQLRTHPSLLHT